MKNSLIALLSVLFIPFYGWAQEDYTNPKEYEIADITVTGTQFLEPNAMINVSGLKKGDRIRIPGDDISSAIKKIWDLSIVSDVDITYTKIEGDKVYLNISLKERPRLARFNFKGIRKGEVETITEKIKLIRGKIVTDALIKNTQLAVKKYFVDKGFLNTTVKITQIRDSSIAGNNVALVINVDKKTKVKIHQITFHGNEIFDEKKLKRKLKDTKQKKITRIFTPSKYIRTKYEDDKNKLIKFYNSEGYRDAIILSDSVYAYDKKTINIDIHLEEGKKYYFRNITWEGNYKYTDEQLSNVLKIKKGDVYNVEEMEKRLTYSPTDLDITSLYMDDGYLFFRIEPVEVGVEGDSVDVEMRIVEGEQATINRVTVSGNTQTSDHVVLREIRTLPGQKFSRSNIIRTQREIATLGYFDPEKVNPDLKPNPADGTVDIEWQVEEKPSDQIELSGGWGGFYGFVGTLGLTFNNFSSRKIFNWHEWRPIPKGDGQKLSLRAQASGPQFQTYSATFVEPWMGGKKPNSFSLSISHSIITNRGYTSNSVPKTSFQTTAFTVGLGRRLRVPDDWFSLSNSVSYLIYNNNNYFTTNNRQSATTYPDGISHNVTFNTTITRNSLDQQTYPRRGSSVSLSVTATPPWQRLGVNFNGTDSEGRKSKLIEYHKWMFDSQWYINIIGKLVLSTRAHMGFIGNYGGNDFTPFERFQVGGSGMAGQGGFVLPREYIGLRGYEEGVIGPQATGGIIYNKFVTELRFLVSPNPAATIFVLGFMEGGNNWGNYKDYNPFDLKRSVGVGARIFMPAFGMIGIDAGKALDNIPGANNKGHKVITFTIGPQFR
jgi:outer membrane protein insertion porin family